MGVGCGEGSVKRKSADEGQKIFALKELGISLRTQQMSKDMSKGTD